MRFYRGEYLGNAGSNSGHRKAVGFTAHNLGRPVTIESIIEHILDDTRETPFISVSASARIAARFAVDYGAVYEIELPSAVELVNPCSFIIDWLIANGVWKGEMFSRAQEALLMATNDEEWLVIGHIPHLAITQVQDIDYRSLR